ncbi:hypothetical protein [Bermanella sp. R86510]|uniref:hypothetical protein n=1 Tax=unclassified Bermanella TaxID=2627862 RepID=UPI0037CA9600
MAFHKHCVTAGILAGALTLTGCGSSSDSNSGSTGRSGPEFNQLSISAIGGSSVEGSGATGGNVEIFKTNSATDLKVLKQSQVDASYELAEQTAEFGINPVTIETTTTVELILASDALPNAGELYMVENQYRLFKSDGTGTPGHESHEVTGLSINQDTTLFLPANANGTSVTRLMFNNDIDNSGVIATVNEVEASRADLELTAAAYYGTGDITTNGEIANYYRQSGGDIEIYAHTIVNSGLINTSGANKSNENTTGNGNGNPGTIRLYGNVFVENTGELRANGGSSDTDNSTDGGDITVRALSVYNTGAINANSGSGSNDIHSLNSADVSISATHKLINTGNISVKGADSSVSDDAGRGGNIELYLGEAEEIAFSQTLINTGNLNVDGGSVSGDATGRAGYGGNILIGAYQPDEELNAARVLEVTGNLSANGGTSVDTTAGNGGNIEFYFYDVPMSTADSLLVGYDEINVSGGNGLYAGSAGDIDITFEDYRDSFRGADFMPTLSGSIYFDTDLVANGGNTIAGSEDFETEVGSGSDGGDVLITATNYSAHLQENEIKVTAKGSINANGGQSFNDSSTTNATGGEVVYVASHKVKVSEAISVNGGTDTHAAGNGVTSDHAGSHAGTVAFISQFGDVTVDTTITGEGGSADLTGGNGAGIFAMAKGNINLKGSYSISGGNATTNDADAFETEGGDAGKLTALSEQLNSDVSATINAEAGSGDRMGDTKIIYVDADCESENCERNALML